MATRPTKSDLADSVQIALDAADTATGVTDRVKFFCHTCLLYTSPSPRDRTRSRMPSSA